MPKSIIFYVSPVSRPFTVYIQAHAQTHARGGGGGGGGCLHFACWVENNVAQCLPCKAPQGDEGHERKDLLASGSFLKMRNMKKL